MQEYINRHGFDDRKALIDYANALVLKYGGASGALACIMYEKTAEAENKAVKTAEMADLPSYGEVAKAVNGTMKTSKASVPSTVGRLTKQVGADTTLKNALRDGAQFAWIPSGDTCAFCITLASRGWQYASKKAIKNGHAEHIHSHCDCQYAIRFNSSTNVAGYDPDKYLQMYEDATGTPKEKINEMRRKLYAEKNGLEVDGEGYAIRKSSAKMKLPNQERLKIPMSKFTNYALDSPKAPDKARAFKEALGYDKSNVDELINQIESKLNEYEAKEKGDRGWGMTYEIIMDITGPNGKTAKVLTAWIDDSANNEMRLTTVHVDD